MSTVAEKSHNIASDIGLFSINFYQRQDNN